MSKVDVGRVVPTFSEIVYENTGTAANAVNFDYSGHDLNNYSFVAEYSGLTFSINRLWIEGAIVKFEVCAYLTTGSFPAIKANTVMFHIPASSNIWIPRNFDTPFLAKASTKAGTTDTPVEIYATGTSTVNCNFVLKTGQASAISGKQVIYLVGMAPRVTK